MTMGRGGIYGNPQMSEWEEELERQRQRIEAEMGGGLLGGAPQEAPQEMGGLLGQPEKRSFMAGTGKFGARDALSLLLTSVADAGLRNRGYDADFSGEMFDRRNQTMEMARKKAEEQAAFARSMAIARQAYPDMDEGRLAAIVTKIGNPSDFKPPEPAPMERNLGIWQGWSEPQRQAYRALKDAESPWRFTGKDGLPYNAGDDGLPDVMTDEEMNKLGGGTGNGAGNFRYRR